MTRHFKVNSRLETFVESLRFHSRWGVIDVVVISYIVDHYSLSFIQVVHLVCDWLHWIVDPFCVRVTRGVIHVVDYYSEARYTGIHDTSFASKSPFKKTWIKKTWIQVCVYTMQEILMNTHKFWREIQQIKWHFWEDRRVAALCIALLCTIVLRRRLSSKKRSTWARKWLRRRRWDVFL